MHDAGDESQTCPVMSAGVLGRKRPIYKVVTNALLR